MTTPPVRANNRWVRLLLFANGKYPAKSAAGVERVSKVVVVATHIDTATATPEDTAAAGLVLTEGSLCWVYAPAVSELVLGPARDRDAPEIAALSHAFVEYGLRPAWTTARVTRHMRHADSIVLT